MVNILFRYIYYKLFKSVKIKKGIHKEFVNNFITYVINKLSIKDNTNEDFILIKKIHNSMLKDKRILKNLNYGQGNFKKRKSIFLKNYAKKASISFKYGRLLYYIANYYNLPIIIELGTGTGISTLFLSTGNKNAQVYTVEGNYDLARIAGNIFVGNGINNIKIINNSFDTALTMILSENVKNFLAFIDGDHSGENLISYVDQLLKYSENYSIIVIDDIRWSKDMYQSWKKLIKKREVSLSIDTGRMGILFILNKQPQEHYFIPV